MTSGIMLALVAGHPRLSCGRPAKKTDGRDKPCDDSEQWLGVI